MARIVWVTERHPPDSGGMAVSSNRLVNSLRDRGHSVTVFHLATHSPDALDDGFRLNGVEGTWRVEGWKGELERFFFHRRTAMEGAIIAGFGGGLPGYLASLWARWLNAPSVVFFRGNDLDRLSHDPQRGWMVHATLNQADLVCAVSTEMRSRLAAMREGPVLFTPVGIIPEEWDVFPSDREKAASLRSVHSPEGRPLIGVFGQLKYKKGLFTAMEVFRDFGLGRHARLLTVGDLPESERKELESNGSDFWSHEAFVPRRDLVSAYLACDVVFIPSLYDGMPNVMLEAMVCGALVVGSRAGGIPDVITDGVNGLLFDAGDGVGAANTLGRAFSFAPGERQRMKEAARSTVSTRFTAKSEADILEAALLQLVRA